MSSECHAAKFFSLSKKDAGTFERVAPARKKPCPDNGQGFVIVLESYQKFSFPENWIFLEELRTVLSIFPRAEFVN